MRDVVVTRAPGLHVAPGLIPDAALADAQPRRWDRLGRAVLLDACPQRSALLMRVALQRLQRCPAQRLQQLVQ